VKGHDCYCAQINYYDYNIYQNKSDRLLVCTDKDTGNSKGFGFVEMGSDQEAQAAIVELNGKSLAGRNLIVNEAKPKKPPVANRAAKERNRGPIPRSQRY
jgi:RNA recognition motif-containing protein